MIKFLINIASNLDFNVPKAKKHIMIRICNLFKGLLNITAIVLILQWLCVHTCITWIGIGYAILWVLITLIILGVLSAI